MAEVQDRQGFINWARDREVDFLNPQDDRLLLRAQIGPWRCPCGVATRSAGEMFDHVGHCDAPREDGR